MIFGPLEILFCLVPFMLVLFTIGVRLAAQNISADKKQKNRGLRPCPNCRKMLNREAYICRFCSQELFGESQNALSDF